MKDVVDFVLALHFGHEDLTFQFRGAEPVMRLDPRITAALANKVSWNLSRISVAGGFGSQLSHEQVTTSDPCHGFPRQKLMSRRICHFLSTGSFRFLFGWKDNMA